MYKCFRVNNFTKKESLDSWRKVYRNQKDTIQVNLNEYIKPNGNIDGAILEKEWFPQIKADVFISHSHKDEDLAIALAGYLYNNYNLISFIDSLVWGYSNDLLKKFDINYCYMESTGTYIYEKRNQTTTHVHLMLASALSKMISNTECLFFLKTPNSINVDAIKSGNITDSVWIYYELLMSKLIKTNKQQRNKSILYEQKQHDSLSIEYEINTNHLIDLTSNDFDEWRNKCININDKYKCLDYLYEMKGTI